MQRRLNIQAKGAAGLIGAFGGAIEPGETPLGAICREISEETSLRPSTEDFRELGHVDVISDRDNASVKIAAKVYSMMISPETAVTTHEGEIVAMTIEEMKANVHRLTPATRAAYEQLIIRSDHVPTN